MNEIRDVAIGHALVQEVFLSFFFQTNFYADAMVWI